MKYNFALDTVLWRLSGGAVFTIRDAVNGGVSIMGNTGAGKSSSSGYKYACSYLSAGFGFLVLCAKATDVDDWREYCRQTGRLDDFVIVEPGGHSYDFLAYECSNIGQQTTPAQNIVSLLDAVINAGSDRSGGGENDKFWSSSQTMLISSVVNLSLLAYNTVSVESLFEIALSAPKNGEDGGKIAASPDNAFFLAYQAAQGNVKQQVETFLNTMPADKRQRLEMAGLLDAEIKENVPAFRTLTQVNQFFAEAYKNLASRTRSTIEFALTSFLFQLLQEPFYSLICKSSSVTPADCLNGKVVVVNVPPQIYNEAGRSLSMAIKYSFQRAFEKRNVEKNSRPVCIWADEAWQFIHKADASFLATARSSKIATVYLSQSIIGYYANMGGAKYEYAVKALLGLLSTKIFHCNACVDTNKYASELIGEDYMPDQSTGMSFGKEFSQSASQSFQLRRLVRPEAFTSLLTGGEKNGRKVHAYIHRQGAPFANGRNHKKIRFTQPLKHIS